MAMTQDTFNRVKVIMDQYNVPPEVWYPIAMAESAGDPNAHGDRTLGGTGSWGLFQLYTGGGQGTGYTPEQLRNIELNSTITAKHLAPAYQAVKGKYSDALLAAEVAIRSGHPGGSVASPYRASVALYNAIKNMAAKGIPESLYRSPGGDIMQPGTNMETGLTSGVGVINTIGGSLDFFQQISSFLSYLSINAGLIVARLALVGIAIPITLLGLYFLLRSLGE